MVKVRVTPVGWDFDSFPGVVEVVVRDAGGRRHRIIDKIPVLTSMEVSSEPVPPIEMWVDAELVSTHGDRVTVSFAHNVETVDGVRLLTVNSGECEEADRT